MSRQRWVFAVAAFGLGLLYTTFLWLVGVEVRIAGRDVALPLAVALELAFGVFGFLLGRSAEARASDHELATLQSRLLHAERLAAIGQLASRVAHEVRNPLAIVRSMVQNLGESPAPSRDEVQSTCRQVLEEIDRLGGVTTSLVGLSRPRAPRLAPVVAQDLLSRVEWLARRLLEGRNVSLRVKEPAGSETSRVSVRADPDLACQVLLGLVANAADATEEARVPDVELGFSEAVGDVVFHVKDGGPGVPADLRERIFDPFFTTKTGCTGLGLAVARELAEAQGGALVLEETETPGLGASFAFRLPRAEP